VAQKSFRNLGRKRADGLGVEVTIFHAKVQVININSDYREFTIPPVRTAL
jgi:hypothetical protein